MVRMNLAKVLNALVLIVIHDDWRYVQRGVLVQPNHASTHTHLGPARPDQPQRGLRVGQKATIFLAGYAVRGIGGGPLYGLRLSSLQKASGRKSLIETPYVHGSVATSFPETGADCTLVWIDGDLPPCVTPLESTDQFPEEFHALLLEEEDIIYGQRVPYFNCSRHLVEITLPGTQLLGRKSGTPLVDSEGRLAGLIVEAVRDARESGCASQVSSWKVQGIWP